MYVFIVRQHAERDTVMANLCVGLSVTVWYCIEMNAHIAKLFPPSGRSMTSATAVTKFHRGILLTGALSIRGLEKFAIFDRNRRLSRKRCEIGP